MPLSPKKNARRSKKDRLRLWKVISSSCATQPPSSLFISKKQSQIRCLKPSRPSTGELLMDGIVTIVGRSSQTIAEVTEAVNGTTGFIAITVACFKSEQRRCTEKKGKMEERCRQYVGAGKRRKPVAASNPSNTGQKPLTDIPDDVKTN